VSTAVAGGCQWKCRQPQAARLSIRVLRLRSVALFGKVHPYLNLASNWIRKFPRTVPASGMVAAHNHHVMVLISHVGGSDWLVHDGHSGCHKTHEHVSEADLPFALQMAANDSKLMSSLY